MGRGSSKAGTRTGGRNAGAARVSETAQTFDINELNSRLANRPEGTFIRSEIPLLVRADDGSGLEIHTEQGYAAMIGDTPVFIQKSRGGYNYNIYGMNATLAKPMRTLAEAKDTENVRTVVDRISTAYNGIDQVREIFSAANREGGMTMDEYTSIVRRQRARR